MMSQWRRQDHEGGGVRGAELEFGSGALEISKQGSKPNRPFRVSGVRAFLKPTSYEPDPAPSGQKLFPSQRDGGYLLRFELGKLEAVEGHQCIFHGVRRCPHVPQGESLPLLLICQPVELSNGQIDNGPDCCAPVSHVAGEEPYTPEDGADGPGRLHPGSSDLVQEQSEKIVLRHRNPEQRQQPRAAQPQYDPVPPPHPDISAQEGGFVHPGPLGHMRGISRSGRSLRSSPAKPFSQQLEAKWQQRDQRHHAPVSLDRQVQSEFQHSLLHQKERVVWRRPKSRNAVIVGAAESGWIKRGNWKVEPLRVNELARGYTSVRSGFRPYLAGAA